MNEIRMRYAVILALLLSGVAAMQAAGDTPLLVESDWLSANLDRKDLVVIDFGRGSSDYEAGHVPGAVFLDRSAIYAEVDGIAGMFPGAETAVSALRAAGVGNRSTVVIYDGANSLWATRAFWTLEYLGHRDVHVLNGGLKKWRAEGRAVSIETPAVAPGDLRARLRPELVATEEYVLANLDNPGVAIVDTRSAGEYNGSDVRSARGGHIPGAVHAEWVQNIAGGGDGTFLDLQELAEFYSAIAITPDREAITLCQTGVRGAHTYFVLRHLGYKNVRLYDGSWEEWGNDPKTPVVQK